MHNTDNLQRALNATPSTPRATPSNKEAILALDTLHRYFARPAWEIDPSMLPLLGQSFTEVVSVAVFD